MKEQQQDWTVGIAQYYHQIQKIIPDIVHPPQQHHTQSHTMSWQTQPATYGMNNAWNAPGAGSAGFSTSTYQQPGTARNQSMVSQYDSQSTYAAPNSTAFSTNNYQHNHNTTTNYGYQQQQQQQIQVPPPPPAEESKMALYTRYYHEWKAYADAPTSDNSQTQWANYYADLSSRAAHYFHSNPGVVTPPADMELPPAPPPSQKQNSVQQQHAYQHPADTTTTHHPNNDDAKSFKVYLDRSLQQCQTPQEKQAMAEASKAVLQKAIRENNLHSKDWSLEPLLTTSTNSNPNVAVGHYGPAAANHVGNYYGSTPTRQAKSSKHHHKHHHHHHISSSSPKKRPVLDMAQYANESYYGPATVSPLVSPTGTSFTHHKKSKKFKRATDTKGFNNSSDTLNKRAQRFASSFRNNDTTTTFEEGTNQGPVIIGTCQVLEKDYLRLTSAPKAELVRPQPVLERHFANLQAEYANEQFRRDYLWFCSQLKAIRQDCTVQHLKVRGKNNDVQSCGSRMSIGENFCLTDFSFFQNLFCVQVYEFHAKVALEQGDLNEFNQCQTQLKYLYPQLQDGNNLPNRLLFLSYRILYSVYMNLHSDKAVIDMKDIFGHDRQDWKKGEGSKAVQHAMATLNATQEGNYYAFFSRLYPSPHDRHQNIFLDLIAPVLRKRALESICGAYRPTADVDFVCLTLKIPDVSEEFGDRLEHLGRFGCVIEKVSSEDGKDDFVLKTKESQIKMPEPKTKSKLM